MKKVLSVLAMALMSVVLYATELPKELQTYKLANGLTVMLWEDHDQPDCEGYVVTRAGAIDEPSDYTGLAHYLEHMLFKGTQRIGAIDWEAEKPLYDSIIILYDQYAEATDAKVRESLATSINRLSMEAAKVSTTEDFFNLLDWIGAEGVNAYTSYDVTCYHNSFPGAQMERWLTIFSDRLIDPVFRTFQAELENVFEEYNMYSNNVQTATSNALFEKIYAGHPYERNVIGKPEHLKNPRLSKLIEFYNTWYVPNNMALIIVGDFDAEATKPLIEKTFSRLQPKELPARPTLNCTKVDFSKNPKYDFKLGYYPSIVWAYDGVKVGDEDEIALQFAISLLNNSFDTGLLDKLNLDGTVSGAFASFDSRRDMGRIIIEAIPYFDVNQQQYESNKATEKIVMAEIEKLKNGQIDDQLITSVKRMYDQAYKAQFESAGNKMQALVNCFTYDQPIADIFTENQKIQALTKEQVMAVAKKYFDKGHMTLAFEEGTPKKVSLPKPKIEPLDPVKGVETEYAKSFRQIPVGAFNYTYNDFSDVTVSTVQENVKLHYTPNTKNDLFSLTLRYGVGTEKIPMLEYAVGLMNTAGVAPSTESQKFRAQLAELGGRLGYGVSDSYFTVQIMGEDANYEQILNLVNRQLLMPKLDQQQLDNIKGSEFSSRMRLPKQQSALGSALLNYVLYGEDSHYIDWVNFNDVYTMGLPQVQSLIAQARSYALDVFYCGTKAQADVVKALPLTEGMMPSTSPYIHDRKAYDKATFFFLPNSEVQQATLYFYIEGVPYSISQDVRSDAFNQYFSGGFTGLVLNEIRTKRSMAYTAYGQNATPQLQGKNMYFMGYIGTQSDKVVDAIDVYMDLLTNMPADSSNMASIRQALRQAEQTAKPSMRGKAQTFEYWQRLGYTDDPAKTHAQEIANLTFEDIEAFYKEHIQGKPVTVILMGDPKQIDLKAIQAKLGCKVTKLSASKLFGPDPISQL